MIRKCKVKSYNNGNIHRAKFRGYTLDFLETPHGTGLAQVWLKKPSIKELFIPKVLPSGLVVDCIICIDSQYDFVKDVRLPERLRHLDRIIIDDRITDMQKFAFAEVDVREVHWPAGCKAIPNLCFRLSKLEFITGIDQVEAVEYMAFAESSIKSIVWPKNCQYIPERCFMGSALETIENIDGVHTVMKEAFASCQLKRLSMPQPYCSFGEKSLLGIDPSVVEFPYYTDAETIRAAFGQKYARKEMENG